jgi:hypothetical protein
MRPALACLKIVILDTVSSSAKFGGCQGTFASFNAVCHRQHGLRFSNSILINQL